MSRKPKPPPAPPASTGYSDAARVAVQETTARVQEMHKAIAATTFDVMDKIPGIALGAGLVRQAHDLIAGGVYAAIQHGSGGLLGASALIEQQLPAGEAPPGRLASGVRSALNAAFGDHLAQMGNVLAIDMGLYRDDAPVAIDTASLRQAFPDGFDRLCLFIHGLAFDEHCWLPANAGELDFGQQLQADAKFGTPYSLPPATADQLGGVKVGDYLDIAPDGTLSGKTLNDKIAAAVAVKSEARLVWNHYEETGKKWKTYDIKMPDGLDYVHVKTKYNSPTGGYGEEVDIAKGGTANHSYGNGTGIFASNTTFRTDGTLHFATETSTGGYTVEIWLTGYHYPTLAELLTETQAAQADTDALAVDQEYRVALLELGLTDDTTTDTRTT